MSKAISNVPFPIQGGGATAAVRSTLPLRIIELSGCTIREPWGNGEMRSPGWRLYLNLDEGAEVTSRGKVTALRAGHLYAIPAWLSWSGRCRASVRHFNAMLDLPSLPRERVAAFFKEVMHLAGPEEAFGKNWLRLAEELARTSRPSLAQIARGHALIWEAMARIFSETSSKSKNIFENGADARLEPLLLWLESNLERNLGRSELSKMAECSEAELARRFRAALGTSPAKWVRDRRLAKAAELLADKDLPLESVAALCGFGDRTRLTKVFAKALGMGPAAYRKRL